jgi:hypothetical protein
MQMATDRQTNADDANLPGSSRNAPDVEDVCLRVFNKFLSGRETKSHASIDDQDDSE